MKLVLWMYYQWRMERIEGDATDAERYGMARGDDPLDEVDIGGMDRTIRPTFISQCLAPEVLHRLGGYMNGADVLYYKEVQGSKECWLLIAINILEIMYQTQHQERIYLSKDLLMKWCREDKDKREHTMGKPFTYPIRRTFDRIRDNGGLPCLKDPTKILKIVDWENKRSFKCWNFIH